MGEDWLGRWSAGRTGWHEVDGNTGLKAHWPSAKLAGDSAGRVLVPLCGKTPDLLWLVDQGHDVVGVELAETAIRQFFDENELEYEITDSNRLPCFVAKHVPLSLVCGDYLDYKAEPFDALYDRGALVALPPSMRPKYVQQTNTLLLPNAIKMIITLEYDQSMVSGPPFAVHAGELAGYWSDLRRVAEFDDLENCPPKFKQAGITSIQEVVWLSR